MENDLLTKQLSFNVIHPKNTANIFSIVIDGKLTTLAKMIQSFPIDEVKAIVNSKDPDGKTPLFYACYFNFQNIVLYLLTKEADPFVISNSGFNCFHICAYRGHLECAQLLYQYNRHEQSMGLLIKVKQLMKQYNFKRTDVQKGVLMSSDRHLQNVKSRFATFQQDVADMFQAFINKLFYDYRRSVSTVDSINRNPIHYSSLSKYSKSLKTAKYLLLYSLRLEGWDYFLAMFNEVQLLEVNSDKKIDPRQYNQASDMCINFLDKFTQENSIFNFMKNMREIQKEVSNTQDDDGYTPMHLASFAGDFAAIQFLLSIGGNPKIRCKKNDKDVLDYAQHDMVRKYMVDLKNAARDGDDKSFQLLVNCGHKVDGKATIYGIAPIHNALSYTHKSKQTKMLDTVFKQEPDVNVTDSNGWTPLHHACQYGDLESVRSLLDRGANIHAFSNKGYYPLHIAAMNNHPEVIELLHQKGANLEATCDNKMTAMHLAAKKGHAEIIKILHRLGANIYAQDDRDWNPLHYAAFYETKDVAYVLSRFDGDREKYRVLVNKKGKSARELITNRDIQIYFQTIWKAAAEGNLDMVRKLVILKHDINEKTLENEYTPLICATKHGHFLIVKFLLENGANPSERDRFGKTAADYAKEKQDYKIFRLLDQQ